MCAQHCSLSLPLSNTEAYSPPAPPSPWQMRMLDWPLISGWWLKKSSVDWSAYWAWCQHCFSHGNKWRWGDEERGGGGGVVEKGWQRRMEGREKTRWDWEQCKAKSKIDYLRTPFKWPTGHATWRRILLAAWFGTFCLPRGTCCWVLTLILPHEMMTHNCCITTEVSPHRLRYSSQSAW